MNVYYDCEFLENGINIDLISIGMVADDGREYYAVNADCQWYMVIQHKWLSENVVPYLPTRQTKHLLKLDLEHNDVKPKLDIAREIQQFLQETPDLDLWAWYGAYDHVALAQLWGPMVNLPQGIPMWTNDIRQEYHRLGNPTGPKQEVKLHHALEDARYNKILHRYILELERQKAT